MKLRKRPGGSPGAVEWQKIQLNSRKSTPPPPITQGPRHISYFLVIALTEIIARAERVERRTRGAA